MSLPAKTFATSSKNEDFPTPVSPTRRMVYGAFALFFDVLMIPLLIDSTSLQYGQRYCVGDGVETYLIVGMLFLSWFSKAFSYGLTDM